jgi:predicted DNA-binding transcriptional regulator AlpA
MTLLLHACRAVSIPTAADVVGVSASTLYRWCREGKFPPALHIGRRWFVSWPLLERYLAGEHPSAADYTRTVRALRANAVEASLAIRAVGRVKVTFSRLSPADRLAAGATSTPLAGRIRAGLIPWNGDHS